MNGAISLVKIKQNSVDIENAFSGMNTEGLEYSLIEATLEAISTKSLTPIIKEELKLKIQSKRLALGQEELPKPVFKEPETPELTQEEIEKRRRRREGNRVAALKCRNKKKQERKSIDTVKSELEVINMSLKRRVEEMERDKEELMHKFKMNKVAISNSNCSLDHYSNNRGHTNSECQGTYLDMPGNMREIKPSLDVHSPQYTEMKQPPQCSPSPPTVTDMSRNICETNFVFNLPVDNTYMFTKEQPSTSGALYRPIDGIVEPVSDQDFNLWDTEIDFLSDDCHLTKPVKCVSFMPVTVDDEAKVPGEDDVMSGTVSPSLYHHPFHYEW